MTFTAGELIGGRYHLEELIGSGGMGDVFRARDTLLERPVALKLVDIADPRRREEVTQRFLREARISAAIQHRHVVQILDFGTHEERIPYIVMELLEGETLADVLGRGERLTFRTIVELVDQVLEGLAAAHDAGVVHRDLKPENIFLVRARGSIHPKILDFGISKLTDERGSARITTTHGHVVGTPAYMSPEQARGVKFIDQRTDLYSMGVVLYELLSGELPFLSENPGDLMVMIVTRHATPLSERVPEVPEALSVVIGRAMEKAPDDRFADARTMQEALRAASAGLAGSATVRTLDERERPASWRKRAEAATAAETTDGRPALTPSKGAGLALGRRPRRSLTPLLSIVLASTALAATVILFSRSSASPSPRFIVVQADPVSRSAQREAEEERPAEAPREPSAPVRVELSPAVLNQPREGRRGEARSLDAAARLAESFRRQKGGVVACVNAHVDEVERTPKLAVRIALDASGRVQSAQVLPASVAQGTMGVCIERAVQTMQFARQASGVSFEVPLTARKEP